MSDIHSVDVEDDQFAYRYDTQLLIDRRDEDLDEDVIADYITEHFEGNCLIAAGGRVGGDEFAVMIEEEMSQEVLEKELEQFFQNISGIQKEVTVSCSIGVYRFTYPKTIKELLTKTDEILYEAKANGRGCFVIR